jgi:hypothetical protein
VDKKNGWQRGKTSSGAAVEHPARAPLRSHGCDSLPCLPVARPERELWRDSNRRTVGRVSGRHALLERVQRPRLWSGFSGGETRQKRGIQGGSQPPSARMLPLQHITAPLTTIACGILQRGGGSPANQFVQFLPPGATGLAAWHQVTIGSKRRLSDGALKAWTSPCLWSPRPRIAPGNHCTMTGRRTINRE